LRSQRVELRFDDVDDGAGERGARRGVTAAGEVLGQLPADIRRSVAGLLLRGRCPACYFRLS
jgi:hypothetical protein